MNVFDLSATLKLDSSEYEDGLAKAKENGGKFGESMKAVGKTIAAGIAVATAAVVKFATDSVMAGKDFDKSMSQVVATMGYTLEEINTSGSEAAQSLETLRNFAQEMGRTTAFSATESADALNYMALAGYSVKESMTMLPNVLNLAAAGNMELATASDMVTDAQTALGIEFDKMDGFVDQMAKTASTTNTSVSQLGDAILTVGGTAKFMTGGTTELNAVLGVLANNGIKGSEAGTHLRNMLLKLSAPTDKGAEALEKLGVNIFDAEGNMRSFTDIFPELQKAMSNLTSEEQMQALSEIFNTRDIAAAQALLSTTTETWDELTVAIGDSAGAAQAMADVQLDNLAGDVTLFKSALEGAQILISDQLTPTLRGFVQFGTDAISTLSNAFAEGGLSGAMDALGTILSEGLAMVIDTTPQMIDAGIQLLEALATGLIDNMPAVANAAVEIMTNLLDSLADFLPELAQSAVDMVLELADTLTNPESLDKMINSALKLIISLANGLIDAIPRLVEKIPTIITNIVQAITQNLPQIVEAGIKLIIKLAEGLIKAIPELVKAIPQIIASILRGLFEAGAQLLDAGKELVNKVKEGIKAKVEEAKQWGKDLITNFKEGLTKKWDDLKNGVKKIGQGIKDFLGFSEPKEGPLSDFHTYAPDMMNLFIKGIKDNEDKLYNTVADAFDFGDLTTAGVATLNVGNSGVGHERTEDQPINITIQSVLDGRIIGETSYRYIRNMQRAGAY